MESEFKYPKLKNRLGILLLFCFDLLTLATIFLISVLVRDSFLPLIFDGLPEFYFRVSHYTWILLVWSAIMIYGEGYSKRFAFWDEIKFLWKSSFMALISIMTLLFVMKRGLDYSRIVVMTMFFVSLVLFPLARIKFKELLYQLGLMLRKVLIVGSGEAARKAMAAMQDEPNLGYAIAGFVDDEPSEKEIGGHKVRRHLEKLERYITFGGIHDVIVAKTELPREKLVELINHIQHKAENTLFIPDISGIAVSGTELRHFFRQQTIIIQVKNNLAAPLIYGTKRVIDYASGLAIAIVFLPVMLLIALIVKLDSSGPALLKQKRLGKKAREFYCYKFRTMLPDAEARLQELLENSQTAREEYDKFWKLTDDPRITRVGNILRKTSLDELPQILNVLRGEMSLIGPRPYLPREWDYIKEESPVIHALPPGITGLWQVSGRNNQDYAFRIAMDSWYVKNWNLWLDVMIFFRTIGVVLKRDGAR
jgi:undecaprenyl-phosphate galactose phosphotransferase